MNASTSLTEVVDRYIDWRNQERPIGRELSAGARRHYVETTKSLRRFLGREPVAGDLTAERANQFLSALLAAGLSPYTVKSRRTALLVLMRFVKREGLTTADPERVRRVHCPPLEIKGYGPASMQRLLTTAAALPGVVRGTGVSRRVYWTAMLLTLWNVGCRIGDIRQAETSKFDPAGRLFLLEGKTGKARWHRLHAATTAAVTACIAANPGRERIWPGHGEKNISRAFTKLAKQAGVGGTSKYTRRGASSELDRLQPGQGWRFLNHSGPQVFEQHYRDADICEDESLAPPELPCGEEILSLYRPKEKAKRGRPRREAKPPEKPVYAKASDVPLTDEVREALRQHPLTDTHLAVLVGHLAAHGIPQRQLAEWCGIGFKRYQDFRYGYRTITIAAADRLRRAFELPTQGCIDDGTIAIGSLPATREIAALLNAEEFGATELSAVCNYAKQALGVRKWKLASNLGMSATYLYQLVNGRWPVAVTLQSTLRDLFTLDGDAA